MAARPVDWITLRCCCGPSVRDLEPWRASGEVWVKTGGEVEQGKGTRFGGLEEALCALLTFMSWASPEVGLLVFVDPVLGIKTWGAGESSNTAFRYKHLVKFILGTIYYPRYLCLLF